MRSSTIPHESRRGPRLLLVAACVLSLLWPGLAHAHFLWLTSEREQGKPVVRAFLSETPIPDLPEFLRHIERSKITAGGTVLGWTRGENTYRVDLPERCPAVIDGFCDLGVMKRDGKAFRLIYTARVQLGAPSDTAAEEPDHLRLRVVARPGQAPRVAVTFRGRPAAGAVVKAFPVEGEPVELEADGEGLVEYSPAAEGRAGLLAKWTEKKAGERDGKSYDEVRYYATLTVAPRAAAVAGATSTSASASASPTPFAALPQAVDSFGGAVLGDWLYVYGGHTGKMHRYNRETVSTHFRRLNLRDRATWEELPCGPPLQGVTLIAHRGRLYRIGGMAPHNAPGKPNDLVSVADFARFDPESKTWTPLPSLPAPRSTHDSVVVGDRIYVIGGWSMNGGDSVNSDFVDSALVFDLSRANATWEKLPDPPFIRRALAVGALGGKVYAIGGLTDDGKVVRSVDVYDPAARTWSSGPELPGGKRQGFAPSAFEAGGRLYVCGADGDVLRLAGAGNRWEVTGRLATPRVAHRLLPGIAHDVLAVGGNSAGAPVATIESIAIGDTVAARVRVRP